MNADMAVTLTGLILELVLIGLLVLRGVHRTLPTFVGFIAVALCTDTIASLVPRFIASEYYVYIWTASLFVEFIWFFGVTLEMGRNLLRHNRATLPNWFLALALFVPAVWALTLLSHWTIPSNLPIIWRIELRLSHVTAVLELSAFLAMIWWSAVQRLHWPPREFRIAVGIGIEALVAFAAIILHSHQPVGPDYHWVDLSASVFYVATLVYWVQYFAFEPPAAVDSRVRLAELAAGRTSGHGGNASEMASTSQDSPAEMGAP